MFEFDSQRFKKVSKFTTLNCISSQYVCIVSSCINYNVRSINHLNIYIYIYIYHVLKEGTYYIPLYVQSLLFSNYVSR